MAASVLPDRERRHLLQFYVAPRLTYGGRTLAALGPIALGLALQFLLPWSDPRLGLNFTLPLLFAGNLFLLVRGYDLKPGGLRGSGEWERSSREAFRGVLDLDRQVARWDQTLVDITCVGGAFFFLLLGGLTFGAVVILGAIGGAEGEGWAIVLAGDAAVLLIPHFVTGTRRGWRPTALRERIESLEIVMKVLEAFHFPACQIQPMLYVAGTNERKTPSDARVFIRFPDASESFLGLQFQVSINEVKGTKFPYLYAVIVAKPEFGLMSHRATIERHCAKLLVEPGDESDVDVVVIRRKTTKTSGYHTNATMVRRIARSAWSAISEILPSG